MNQHLGLPRSILFFRPNAVGDFVFALPCLLALKAQWPQARITYIGREWHREFLANRHSPVDEVLVMPPCPGINHPESQPLHPAQAWELEDFVARMREREFDLAIQAFGGGRHANPLLLRFGARRSIGLQADGAPDLDASLRYGPLQNRRIQLLQLAQLAGASISLPEGPELCLSAADREAARAALPAAWTRDMSTPLVMLQPGSTDERRCWPVQHFHQLAQALIERGLRLVINGSGAERAKAQAVALGLPASKVCLLPADLSLSALCGVLRLCRLVVSNDTGPLHLALALQIPSVGIYWLSNLIESGPLWQDGHRPLMATRTRCPVCNQENLVTRCELDESFVADIQPEQVLAQVDGLLAGTAIPSPALLEN